MTDSKIITPEAAGRLKGARFVDARWFLPTDGRKGRDEYDCLHLPGAVFFDIDDIAGQSDNHPHLAPSPAQVTAWLGRVGIAPEDPVIVYDETGFFSAPRVWFFINALGHRDVRVLDGGLAAWRKMGEEVTAEVLSYPAQDYPLPDEISWPVANREMISHALAGRMAAVIDARPTGRFAGRDPEPRPGLSSGHMPGAINVPFTALIDSEGQFLKPDKLDMLFRDHGLTPAKPVIASCGSGISACVLLLGMAEAGWPMGTLYDGSWIEWASHPETEIIVD